MDIAISSTNNMTLSRQFEVTDKPHSHNRAHDTATLPAADASSVFHQSAVCAAQAQRMTSVAENKPMHEVKPRAMPSVSAGDVVSESESSLSTSIKHTLIGDAQGNVHEEELQHALVVHLLEERSPEALAAYHEAFNQVILHASAEDAVKEALRRVVEDGFLDHEQAEQINGISFQAAQLDDNLTALYDNRGSESDPTIAVMELDDAIAKAELTLEKFSSGELTIEVRSLDAPSNGSGAVTADGATPSSAGFLWKPSSERDGKLVVLFPPSLSGQIESAGIYSEIPPTNTSLIESGRFSGDSQNGGRAHFRFTRPGSSYPDGVYVVAHLRDGRYAQFKIGETSQRNE